MSTLLGGLPITDTISGTWRVSPPLMLVGGLGEPELYDGLLQTPDEPLIVVQMHVFRVYMACTQQATPP
jgi:hypothetical protein